MGCFKLSKLSNELVQTILQETGSPVVRASASLAHSPLISI